MKESTSTKTTDIEPAGLPEMRNGNSPSIHKIE